MTLKSLIETRLILWKAALEDAEECEGWSSEEEKHGFIKMVSKAYKEDIINTEKFLSLIKRAVSI